MPLDVWSVVIACVLSVFSFLVFLLAIKKAELTLIENQVVPASKEALEVLIKNFLSFGEIPTKSKLISVMTSLARKHHVQLLSHLPIQNVIDNLIYYVISNDLLDPYKKKEISDRLIKLKGEPMTSEDYIQMLTDNEEASSWKQKLIYSNLAKVLITSSLIIITLGVCSSQLKATLGPKLAYIFSWALVACIGFSVLVAAYTIGLVYSHFKQNQNKANSVDKKGIPASLSGIQQAQLDSLNPVNAAIAARKQGTGLLGSMSKANISSSRHSQTNKSGNAERMISIDNVANLSNEASAKTDTETSELKA